MTDNECKLLFGGETLDGWFSTGFIEGWTVAGGAIVLDDPSGGSFLCAKAYFVNFVYDFEYKRVPGCNSGVYFPLVGSDRPADRYGNTNN